MQRQADALEAVAARAAALEGQVTRLEAGRFAGLDDARATLTERTAADDATGAAAAAEEVARIEAEAAATAARLRPLQLQLAEVGKLKAAAEQRVAQAREQQAAAERRLQAVQGEQLALRCDDAAIALRDALIDCARVGRSMPGRVDFTIGASTRLLQALGTGGPIHVSPAQLHAEGQAERPVDTSVFDIDPLTLAATMADDSPPPSPAAAGAPAWEAVDIPRPVRERVRV